MLSERMEADEGEGRHSVLIVTFIHHRMAKMACENEHWDLAEYLILNGANPDVILHSIASISITNKTRHTDPKAESIGKS